MTTVITAWAAVEISGRGAVDVAGAPTPYPVVTAVYGPFDTQAETVRFADQYNAEAGENENSWHVIVRPLIKLKIAADVR